MIFSKKINLYIYSFLAIFIIGCLIFIIRINLLYPNAKIVDNTETGYIMWRGCKIEADSVEVFSPEEFVENFPEYVYQFDYLLNNRHDNRLEGIAVFKIKITNETEKSVDFRVNGQAYACSTPSMWANGLAALSEEHIIEPNKTVEYVVGAAYQPTLVNKKYIERMKTSEFMLVFSNYPERLLLRFNYE